MTHNLKQRLVEAAMEAGAQKVGFAHAGIVGTGDWETFKQWLEAGNHGGMSYLENHLDIRLNPQNLLDAPADARTVMVCAFSYYHPEQQAKDAAQIAMYAHGSDYHEVLRERLQHVKNMLESEGYTARICVDSAPIMERYWAVQAGVGFIGRNRMLIVPDMGSYFFLAEIITDAAVKADTPCPLTCGNCHRCIAACPGGALRTDSGFDCHRCISYLTIEHHGELPHSMPSATGEPAIPLQKILGPRVYGCDMCQSVCPHNAAPPVTAIDAFHLRPALRTLSRADILSMSQKEFSAIFSHSAVKRAKLTGLQRNAQSSGM